MIQNKNEKSPLGDAVKSFGLEVDKMTEIVSRFRKSIPDNRGRYSFHMGPVDPFDRMDRVILDIQETLAKSDRLVKELQKRK